MSSPIENNNTVSSATELNKVASAENNKISLEEIKDISRAAKMGGSFFRRPPVGFGDRLAAARSMVPATTEHKNGGDGGFQLPFTEPVHHLPFGGNPLPAVASSSKTPFGVTVGAAGTFGEPRKPRKLLTAVLRLLHSASTRQSKNSASLQFLETVCPVGGEVTAETDFLVPTVVYTVTYMMTDKEFTLYQQMVMRCPIAHEVQKMLGVGGAQFDLVNDKMETFNLFVEGKCLEEILREEVMEHRLGVTWDLGESLYDPYRR